MSGSNSPRAPKVPTVTLKELAAGLAETHNISTKQTEAVLDRWVGLVTEHLKQGNRVRLGELGVLVVRDRAARTGRNPGTGAVLEIAAGRNIAFRPSTVLRLALGGLPGDEGTDPAAPDEDSAERQSRSEEEAG